MLSIATSHCILTISGDLSKTSAATGVEYFDGNSELK